MITGYSYEVWSGKKCLGTLYSGSPLNGASVQIPEVSEFKRPYNQKPKWITLPISSRVVYDNGVDLLVRTILCAKGKSARQISLLRLSPIKEILK
jgi:hypothetical protein